MVIIMLRSSGVVCMSIKLQQFWHRIYPRIEVTHHTDVVSSGWDRVVWVDIKDAT